MSRSYKKHPYCGDKKQNKEIANRRVRRKLNSNYDLNFSNKSYKKVFDSYDICDWWFGPSSFEDYCHSVLDLWERLARLGNKEPRPTIEQLKKDYNKYYKRK